MNAMTFDTHAAAKEFESAGFTAEQVDALVNVTRQTTSLPDVSILATKSDLAELRIATKSDIAELRAELRAEVATAKLQAITVLISAMAVFTAVGTLLSKVIH
jgi:hypothetical protein